jgi:SAM-dependent methyltransferase
VLELGCGNGRVAIPLARAGFRVAALDSSGPMLSQLRDHLGRESEDVRLRVEPIQDDMRRFNLDRIFRLICLPFNSMLLLVQPQERQATLERVREHLAPSGAFAFDIFTPDPTRLVDDGGWTVDLDFETNNPEGEGPVRVLRECWRQVDLGRQIISIRFRYRVSAEGGEPASWEDALDLAYIFPRELELILERQGFRITERFGDAGGSAFEPTPDRIQQQFVVAQLIP